MTVRNGIRYMAEGGVVTMPNMSPFNPTSMQRTQGVDPRLVEILTETRARLGVPFEITEGMRNADRQRELVAAGKSQTQNSRHLHGNAIDIHIVDPNTGEAVWDFEAYRPIADMAKQIAAEKGYTDLVWGGDWETLKDGVHFELKGGGGQYPGEQPLAPQYTRTARRGPEESGYRERVDVAEGAIPEEEADSYSQRLNFLADMLQQVSGPAGGGERVVQLAPGVVNPVQMIGIPEVG